MTLVKVNEPWLGSVPSEWISSRIRNVCQFSPGYSGNPPEPNELCTVVPMECLFENGTIDTNSTQLFEDVMGGLPLFEMGDVLFAKITPCMENGKGAFVDKLPTRYAFGSTEFLVLRSYPWVHPKFLYYYTRNPIFRAYAAENMYGAAGQKRVSSRFLKDTRLFLPTLPEQKRIAAYLDASCAIINGAIITKQRQTEILENLKKTTIHQAVTRGLNSDTILKNSDVEWFDKIPSHWNIDRLKDVVMANRDAIKVGPFGSDLLLNDMTEDGIKVFDQRTVIDRDFISGTHFISPEKYSKMKAFTVYPGDLLITTRGTIGRCAIVPDSASLAILHPCLMRVQTNKNKLLPEYLAILIQDCSLVLRQLQMMSAATTIDVIYSDSLKRTYLPLPPVSEQKTIIEYLNKTNSKFSLLSNQIEHQIESLFAYRKSLIHECVTGQRRISEDDVKFAETILKSKRMNGRKE